MEDLLKLSQIIVAISVAYVWIFRFHNVLNEFKQFELSELPCTPDIPYCDS